MGDKIRLDRLISNMGRGSRSTVRAIIKKGGVLVDGRPVLDPGFIIDPASQKVTVGGESVEYRQFIYLMMNKPEGLLSASRDGRDKTVMDILPEPYSSMELFVAGRLDKNTTGLLILTNDGPFAHNMLAPKKHVFKTYRVLVDKPLCEADERAFEQGIPVGDEYVSKPGRLVISKEDPRRALIMIREGKFHQIKRMLGAVGKGVIKLERIKIGRLSLGSLPLGEVRELSPEEAVALLENEENLP